MLKRSRITSYLGIVSLGLVIIPMVLQYFLEPDILDTIILLPGMLFGLFIFPTIVCSYFELKVAKHNLGYLSPPERQSVARILSLIYGISFLFFGTVMLSALLITSEFIFLINIGPFIFSWIIGGILGIVGAIVYRDTPRNLSSDENLKRRKIGFSTVMICITLLVTMFFILNTGAPYYRKINVNKDAYVYEYYPDSNYGQDHQIHVHHVGKESLD